jgi:hypothetical protein
MDGKSVPDLARLRAADIEDAVGGLSAESKHSAVLCVDAVKAWLAKARASAAQAGAQA